MGGWGLLTRTIQDGQGYKNEMNKGSQTRWSHESQRRILLMCGDVNEGAPASRSAEAEGCSCSPHLTEQDLLLLIVSPPKPFKYPLLTLTRRSHRRSPAAQRDVHEACGAIIQALVFPSAHSDADKIRNRAAGTSRTSRKSKLGLGSRSLPPPPLDRERVTSQLHRPSAADQGAT